MADVIYLDNIARGIRFPADTVLAGGIGQGLKSVIVIGLDPDGGVYFASSSGDAPNDYWLLSLARRELLGTLTTPPDNVA
jgi:hypothetical protein